MYLREYLIDMYYDWNGMDWYSCGLVSLFIQYSFQPDDIAAGGNPEEDLRLTSIHLFILNHMFQKPWSGEHSSDSSRE